MAVTLNPGKPAVVQLPPPAGTLPRSPAKASLRRHLALTLGLSATLVLGVGCRRGGR